MNGLWSKGPLASFRKLLPVCPAIVALSQKPTLANGPLTIRPSPPMMSVVEGASTVGNGKRFTARDSCHRNSLARWSLRAESRQSAPIANVESRGGISPQRAPKTVHEPLDLHGSLQPPGHQMLQQCNSCMKRLSLAARKARHHGPLVRPQVLEHAPRFKRRAHLKKPEE